MTILDIGEKMLICCFEVMMLNSFSRILLNSRRRYERRSYFLVAIVFTTCILTMVNSFDNSLLNLICVPIIYFAFISTCYSKALFRCIICTVCFFMLAMAPEFIVSIIFSLSSFRDAEKVLENELSGLCLTLIAKVITFILVKCVEQIHKKSAYTKVSNGVFCYLIVLPVATMILFIGLFYADIHIGEKNKVFLEVGTCMLLFANAFMFYLFDRMVETMEKASKIERLYMKSKVESKHYQQVEQINERHRTLLHDIKKYIRTAAELLQAGEKDCVMQMFGKMDVRIGNTSRKSYCENKILNAILSERQAKAVESGIEYSAELSPDLYADYIDDIDIISIVGNLVDNAMEAARQTERGFVKIRMFMANKGHFMVWEVSNNFLKSPVLGKGGFITSKCNKEEHGIGIHTVEKIVKLYGGNLKIHINSQEFHVSIIFQIDKGL